MSIRDEMVRVALDAITSDEAQHGASGGYWDSESAQYRWSALAEAAVDALLTAGWLPQQG